jgi:hypothetical protein
MTEVIKCSRMAHRGMKSTSSRRRGSAYFMARDAPQGRWAQRNFELVGGPSP